MSLICLRNMLEEARKGEYAAGYFESWDFGSLEATLKAAEELNSPVIIGFGARTFTQRQSWNDRKLASFAAMGKTMTESSSVPVSFILNETDEISMLRRGVELGFNCVMFEGSHLPVEKNIDLAARLVKEGKRRAVDVEAELVDIRGSSCCVHSGSPRSAASSPQETDSARPEGLDQWCGW